jgi:hypothetical protein
MVEKEGSGGAAWTASSHSSEREMHDGTSGDTGRRRNRSDDSRSATFANQKGSAGKPEDAMAKKNCKLLKRRTVWEACAI